VPRDARSPGNRWHDHHGHRRDLLDEVGKGLPLLPRLLPRGQTAAATRRRLRNSRRGRNQQ
jgi:hypothetical protein